MSAPIQSGDSLIFGIAAYRTDALTGVLWTTSIFSIGRRKNG